MTSENVRFFYFRGTTSENLRLFDVGDATLPPDNMEPDSGVLKDHVFQGAGSLSGFMILDGRCLFAPFFKPPGPCRQVACYTNDWEGKT